MKKNNIITPVNRNDLHLMRLRMDMGLKGYAIYCLIREFLMERGGSCPTADYSLMAFDFRAEEDDVRRVAEGYSLFTLQGGMISILSASDDNANMADGERSETPVNPDSSAPEGERRITKRITKRQEKKGKENSPLHPLIRKDKEKDREERKEILASCNSGETASGSDGANAGSDDNSAFYARFRRYWNLLIERMGSRLRPISIMNASRRRQLDKLRLGYTDNQISWFVYHACSSPYLNARDGRLKQPADLNWMLLSDDRIVKIIEGNL